MCHMLKMLADSHPCCRSNECDRHQMVKTQPQADPIAVEPILHKGRHPSKDVKLEASERRAISHDAHSGSGKQVDAEWEIQISVNTFA